MHIVAFVTQKGGAGKSTLASNVAVAARKAGERVFVCDLDPLQSLVKWSRARKALDVPAEHMPAEKLGRALAQLEREGVTLVIVDTPASDTPQADEAIRAADLCVIPARPNTLDIWASETTLAKVRASGKAFAFLLNQCPPAQQSARVARGAQALQEMGALLAPMVSTRVDYQEAVRLGLGVVELNPKGAAAREMATLWGAIGARLRDKASATDGRAAAEPARLPYQDFFEQAVRASGVYADFVNTLLRFSRPQTRPTAADPDGAAPEKRRRIS
ncbi:division plane positioning ATPase MipZ [Methylocystis sp. JAN1]|uniref:division plane positioning ATPase MipZ n=1 Tax=Methylocystis sp. JAN1 TaxID=3397211 RepID=UPI003FA2C992